jgi:hypothetical protein
MSDGALTADEIDALLAGVDKSDDPPSDFDSATDEIGNLITSVFNKQPPQKRGWNKIVSGSNEEEPNDSALSRIVELEKKTEALSGMVVKLHDLVVSFSSRLSHFEKILHEASLPE